MTGWCHKCGKQDHPANTCTSDNMTFNDKINILQINVNHASAAQALLEQRMIKEDVDIALESKGTPVILGGDVNARSKLWGDVKTNLGPALKALGWSTIEQLITGVSCERNLEISKGSSNGNRENKRKPRKSYREGDSSSTELEDAEANASSLHAEPSPNLAAILRECAQEVELVRTKSSNLQGTYNKKLRLAAEKIKKVSSEIVSSAFKETYDRQRINDLISENNRLNKVIRKLESKVKSLEDQMHQTYQAHKESLNNLQPVTSNGLDAEKLIDTVNHSIDAKLNTFKKEILSLFASNLNQTRRNTNTSYNLPVPVADPSPLPDNPPPNLTASPSVSSSKHAEIWSTIVKKKAKMRVQSNITANNYPPPQNPSNFPPLPQHLPLSTNPNPKSVAKKPKNTEVIYLTTSDNSNLKLPQIIAKARENINLHELGIDHIKPRASLSGGLILEIPKKNEGGAAANLAQKIRGLFNPNDIRVSCPIKYKEILLTSLDCSVSQQEVTDALKTICGKNENFILGPIRQNPRGSATLWCKCDEAAVFKLVSRRSVQIGWSVANVHLLDPGPAQCFKCWAYGHVRGNCPSSIDMTGWCHKCGKQGHPANTCTSDNMTFNDKINILQINVNHASAAQALLEQRMIKEDVDIDLVSEPLN
ncbi:uncharacterized protein LOC108622056 [Ceratina calcarata]|uniref:Uncharacterized protein LOC108622056 n=1 Tax=Ceratina calcarata TaxID=156304 RepID=A0AAJ7IRZ3_9HYME|nr:uncharacterized protein LOC108622056 [Ceratina calcarata]